MNIGIYLKKIMWNRKYLIAFLSIMIVCFMPLGREIIQDYGLDGYIAAIEAPEVTLLYSTLTISLHTMFLVAAPLMACFACSQGYAEDYEANMTACIATRDEKKRYHKSHLLASMISGFLLVALPLVISFGVSLIAYPLNNGLDSTFKTNAYSLTPYFKGLMGYWYVFAPNFYFFFHVILIGLATGLLCGISYSISLFTYFNKYISVLITFAFYLFNSFYMAQVCPDYAYINVVDLRYEKTGFMPMIIVFIVTMFILCVLKKVGTIYDEQS